MDCFASLAMTVVLQTVHEVLNPPDGQITWAIYRPLCPAPFEKIFWFSEHANQLINPAIPSHSEGRFAIVTNAGWDAVDADGAFDERRGKRTAKSCGPDASTLASSLRKYPQATVTKKPDRRGEYDISRKPSRGECRVFAGVT